MCTSCAPGGNTNELRDVNDGFGKSYLFFINTYLPLELGQLEKGVENVKSTAALVVSEALSVTLENLREQL